MRFSLFDFLGKKVTDAQLEAVVGKKMTELSFRELALQIAISYIANTLSKCEFKVYNKNKEVKDLLYYKLNVSPNHNENSSQFINKMIETYYYNGEALVVPHGNGIYCADDFTVDDTNPLKPFIYKDIVFGTERLTTPYTSKDVFRIKLDNRDVKKLVEMMYTQYGELVSLAIQTYKRTNGKKYKYIIEDYTAGDKQFNEKYKQIVEKQLKPFIENDNAVFPKYKGTDLVEFSTATPMDANDIITLRKEIFEITAQAFKLPLSMMYGNITNMNEIVKVYLSICIDPLADMISEEFTRKYFTYNQWKDGYFVRVDTSCINHIDILEVADAVAKVIGSGLCHIDDLRERVGMNALGTEFSTSLFMTKNYELADNVLKEKKGGEADEQTVLPNGADGE